MSLFFREWLVDPMIFISTLSYVPIIRAFQGQASRVATAIDVGAALGALSVWKRAIVDQQR